MSNRRPQGRHAERRRATDYYLKAAGHGVDDNGALFRPIRNNRTRRLDKALTPDAVYKLVRAYLAVLGFEIGAHALRATAATNEAASRTEPRAARWARDTARPFHSTGMAAEADSANVRVATGPVLTWVTVNMRAAMASSAQARAAAWNAR